MDARKIACFFAAAFIGSALVAAGAAPVHARPRPVTVVAHPDEYTRIVRYADLPLTTKAGRRMLLHRVSVAVQEVCPDTDDFLRPLDSLACEEFAWDGARPQMRRAIDRALSGADLAGAIEISSNAAK